MRFEHDGLGRVTLRQKTRLSRKPDTWRYTRDTENRLTSATTPDGESVVEEVRFTWDGLTLCEQSSNRPDVPGTVALTWDHRDVVPLAQTERILTADDRQEEIDRRFFAIATDLVGTPTELIDASGDIAWRSRSTLWGTTAWARDSSAYSPLRFPGQYYDPETGLHYNYFRHYDPETGHYTSPDPLGLAPAPHGRKTHVPAGRGHRRDRRARHHPGPGHHGVRTVGHQGRFRGGGARRQTHGPRCTSDPRGHRGGQDSCQGWLLGSGSADQTRQE